MQAGRQVVAENPVKAPALTLPAGVSEAAVAACTDINAALSRLGGNLGIYRRMLGIFVKDLAAMPAQLAACVANNEGESASRLLHTLKGQAGTLGMTALSAEAARSEKQFAAALAPGKAALLVTQTSRAIDEASPGLAALLQALQAAEAPVAVAPAALELDTDAVLAHLREITRHLQNADMAATEVMADLQRQYGSALGKQLQPMDEAISALDFDRALRLCDALINEMREGQPA